MRCVLAAFVVAGLLSLQPSGGLAEEALDLNKVIENETPEQLCPRVAPDPFSGFGPDE
jgi:hypothetical protein